MNSAQEKKNNNAVVKRILPTPTEDNLKEIENIVNLNNDLQEMIHDVDFSSDVTDLDFQITILKDKEKNSILPQKYTNELNFETSTPFTQEQMFQDYIIYRDNLNAMIESAKQILKSVPIESGMLKPVMIQSITGCFKEIRECQKGVIDMYDRMNKFSVANEKKKDRPNIEQQSNTFVFGGTTSEMNDLMKKAATNTIDIQDAQVL